MLCMPRKLDENEKIQVASIPEIKDGMTNVATRISRKVKFSNRKLRPGPLMNAVFVWFLTRTEDVQEEIAREYVAKLEAILEADAPVEMQADRSHPVVEGMMTVGEMQKIAKDGAAAKKRKSS